MLTGPQQVQLVQTGQHLAVRLVILPGPQADADRLPCRCLRVPGRFPRGKDLIWGGCLHARIVPDHLRTMCII